MQIIGRRIIITAAVIAIFGVGLMGRLFYIHLNRSFYLGYDVSVPRKVTVVCSYGDIYDRNGVKLVNRSEKYLAVINPKAVNREVIEPHITDTESMRAVLTVMHFSSAVLTAIRFPQLR